MRLGIVLILEPFFSGSQNELNSFLLLLFVGKFNFLFFLAIFLSLFLSLPRQHELFNDPRLGAFMQMEGLINTKTVA